MHNDMISECCGEWRRCCKSFDEDNAENWTGFLVRVLGD